MASPAHNRASHFADPYRWREFSCPVVHETVRIRAKALSSADTRGRFFVQCDQSMCQYVEKNRPPCPLHVGILFEDKKAGPDDNGGREEFESKAKEANRLWLAGDFRAAQDAYLEASEAGRKGGSKEFESKLEEGNRLWLAGDFAGAQHAFAVAYEIGYKSASQAVKGSPWHVRLLVVHHRIGDVLSALGSEDAGWHYKKALEYWREHQSEGSRETERSGAASIPLGALSSTAPLPDAHPEEAVRLNIDYQARFNKWHALRWWKRLFKRRPEPPPRDLKTVDGTSKRHHTPPATEGSL